ncbi:hypothetical protein F018LOC_00829 [Pectobacterium versatile]|jgi:hypothetical protein|nr:hypothetical protein F018LOC_00829 [Pectobacterium versatile]
MALLPESPPLICIDTVAANGSNWFYLFSFHRHLFWLFRIIARYFSLFAAKRLHHIDKM